MCVSSAPSSHELSLARTGAPLLFDDLKLPALGYDVFMGVQLANAYRWIGCPDDTPDGPVALRNTPQVPRAATALLCPALHQHACLVFWNVPKAGLHHGMCRRMHQYLASGQ